MSEQKMCPLLTNHAREHYGGPDFNTVVHCQGEACAWWDPARERCIIYAALADVIGMLNLIARGKQ